MMKFVAVPAAALSLVLATGCATTKNMEQQRQQIEDNTVTADQAMRTAEQAESSASRAQSTAREADSKAERALEENARLREMMQRMERTYEDSGAK
ncbi:MAG: Lpp/OprI family alanine-zipper lipoprotein [Ectothiorhodospira sp.]